MTEILLGLIILLLLGVLVFLIVLSKRRGGRPEVEGELRGQVAAREAELASLRKDLAAAESASTEAKTRLDAERRSFEEQRALLDEAERKLKDAFSALSADALKDSRAQFLSQAAEKMKPIETLIRDYKQKLDEIETARNKAYGGLEQHLNGLLQSGQKWEKEAHQLSTALKSPTGSGEWGQLALRNVVELAGMSKHCDFDEQVAVVAEDGLKRPDMKVRLPNHRTIVVDAKAPLNAYREAVNAPDDKARGEALARHAQAVRGHMRALSQKSYWAQFQPTPEFVVLFLPGESFFAGAVEQDHALIEDSMKSGVVLASPTTLLALLKAVAYGWQQEELAKNAEQIAEAGKELYDRIRVFAEHLNGVGDGLRKAGNAYEKAAGSYERMLVPGARRLADLGASSGKVIPELPAAEIPARRIAAPGDDASAAADA